MDITRFARVPLAVLPTPLEECKRLSALLNGVQIFAKRDDATGLGGGGNKIRKLEFLLGDALAQGADTIITQGAVQSNHVRQTVAACAKLGLSCRAILERRVADTGHLYQHSGNILLNQLMGIAAVRHVPANTDMNAQMLEEAALVQRNGGKPYIVPGGGSNPLGALGYVNAVLELMYQTSCAGVRVDHIVVTSGSSGTHAGLAAGLQAFHIDAALHGISVRHPASVQQAKVIEETGKVCSLLGVTAPSSGHIRVYDGYVDGGYGVVGSATWDAIALAAQQEGMVLGPVYTGKAFAGLVDLCNGGVLKSGETVVFFHTGGLPGLFAYGQQWEQYLQNRQ